MSLTPSSTSHGGDWESTREASEQGTTRAATGPQERAHTPPHPAAELTVLAHPDVRRVGERTTLRALSVGMEFLLSRTEAAFCHPGGSHPRPLGGLYLSRRPICLRQSAEPSAQDPGAIVLDVSKTRTEVEADGERVAGERGFSSAEIERGVVLLLARKVVLLLHRMKFPRQHEGPSFGLVGESASLLQLCREIRRLAPLEVPVLLRGETGTGKELAARALHAAGERRHKPFVAVNMGALGPSLAAAELFGAVRGAYTGADRQKAGYFQSAHGGTLFLDEIGEAPPEVQVMLLRALESHEIVPVGSTTPVPINVRIIAATDARLEEAIAADRFRAPLFHRLAGYSVRLPALRERRDDLGRLLVFFLEEELTKLGERGLGEGEAERGWPPAELVARLALYDWPGNVRELRNVARRLAIVGREGSAADLEDLLTAPRQRRSETESPLTPAAPEPRRRRAHRKLSEIGEQELLAALRAHRWDVHASAEALAVSRPNLYRLIAACPMVRTAKELGPAEIEAAVAGCAGDLEAAAMQLEVSLLGLKRRMGELGLAPG